MSETAIFWNGVVVGVSFATIVFFSVITLSVRGRLRSPTLKRAEELSKRGDELIRRGTNSEIWKNEEQREAWNRSKEEWQRDVDQWRASL